MVLVAMAAAWGSGLTIVKSVTADMPVADFMAVRYLIAAAALTLVARRAVLGLGSISLRRAVALGVVWGVAQLVQVSALRYTNASVSGFIGGLFVVITPVLAWLLLRNRIPGSGWAAVVIASIGFAILALKGVSLGVGELFTAFSAILYALQIVGLSAWSRRDEIVGMSAVQMIVVAVMYIAAAAPQGIATPATTRDWILLLYLALVIAAGGLVAQMWAQTRLSPTRSALILALEPVFAAGSAIAFAGEPLTWRLAVGGCLILGATIMSELAPPWTLGFAARAPKSF
ncbi:DMT family transporter [Nocardioides pocheonensis]|nr:DMT family transporter [Nocardioides pocheonensis]